MDLVNLTFLGLIGLGTVNVIGFFKPDMDSRLKFALSFAVIFTATFVPVELGSIILDKAKLAISVALTFSGIYKLATKAGGQS
jgi:hypothetical protein